MDYRNYGSGNNYRGYYRGNQPRNMNSCGCNTAKEMHPYECNINREMHPCDTDCDEKNKHLRHMPVGMGYVPMQPWGELYESGMALCQGTAFPDLNLIFCGVRG